ncbi:MAG: hypothetical protein H6669_17390 [Ardenticatenaceae bacterium]|nr:hypothetical protein [Ardenticatenaceae bacterium]
MSFRRPLSWLLGLIVTGIVVATAVTILPPLTPTTHANPTAATYCPPLDPPTGPTITVNNQADLTNQATNAAAGTTIWIAPGTYNMSSYVHIIHNGIDLRGQTGNRDDVILDFGGMISGQFGILVDADDVTIADLTIRNAAEHGVSVQARDRTILYNLHILDINNQLVKVNPTEDRSRSSEAGLLACSRLEYTTTAPDNYTNGISAHDAHGWVVRDNEWVRILTSDGTPVPAVLFWNNSSDTIVERNFFLDCGRGVAFGLNNGHTGGIVRNNMFLFREPHDVAIEMADATGWLVAHNTAVLLNPASGLTWGMEARFDTTQGSFVNNLSNMAIWVDRDGAQATSSSDVTNAQTSWFVDALNGDLHLAAGATAVIDQASPAPQVTDDFDGDTRPIGSSPDVGADEYGIAPPTAVTDLHITQTITTTDTLTATLTWTPPANAITTTIRYANSPITEANWNSAPLLTDSLAGDVDEYTAVIPYTGSTLYFALKTGNDGGISALSNNIFWPQNTVFLPIVLHS